MGNELKRYELIIDDNCEDCLQRISIVTEPAIEENFFYFKKSKMKFKIVDTYKHMITGPVMVPDIDILRVDEETGEYFNVYFTKDTILKCLEVFYKFADINNTNIEHEVSVDGVAVIESWIVDKENGKGGGKNFNDIPDGTWMSTFKIDNDVLWDDFIKTGILKGFSVEGMFVKNFSKMLSKVNKDIDIDIIYNNILDIIKRID